MQSLNQIASNRLKNLKFHNVHNRARAELEHNLELFENKFGIELGGVQGMTIPKRERKSLPEGAQTLLDNILREFIDDPTSSVKGIKAEFKKLPSSQKQNKKKYKPWEMSKLLDISERVRKENKLRDLLKASGQENKYQYHDFWETMKDTDYDYDDILDAMLDITNAGDSNIIGLETGEGVNINDIGFNSEQGMYNHDKFSSAILNYLINVQAKRR